MPLRCITSMLMQSVRLQSLSANRVYRASARAISPRSLSSTTHPSALRRRSGRSADVSLLNSRHVGGDGELVVERQPCVQVVPPSLAGLAQGKAQEMVVLLPRQAQFALGFRGDRNQSALLYPRLEMVERL